jgi:serine/threonine protein kinase
MEQQSVEAVCNLLARSRLLSPDDVRQLHQRWGAETRDADDVAAFRQWLVAREYLTEWQVGLVLRGKIDHFFFGPYKILERVGKGRMAGVYKAVHHTLGQAVAIKVLPPSKAKDPETLARFQREARLAMKLDHANVVRTFQAGENDGLHHIVMEYLDGETLEDVLRRRGKLPPAEAVRLAYQALLALQYIHEQGMIHRDIKPGNLMLLGGDTASTQRAAVKIMDIGLGKALFDEGAGPVNAALTNEGSLLGTPDYMAPEQARSVQTADIRADIYSLGCTLYQCLTGQVPFVESNLVRLLMRHAGEPPRPLAQLNPAVPAGMQPVMDSMLAKDPAQRYPTPGRAAQALQALLATREEAPARPTTKMRAYLQWLDSQSGEINVPKGEAGARPTPGVVLVPVAAEEPDGYPKAAPEVPKRAPEPPPKPAAPRRKKKPTPLEPKERVALPQEEAESSRASGLLDRRDVLMIGIGGLVLGVVVLLVSAFVYALNRLLGPRRQAPPEPEPKPAESE